MSSALLTLTKGQGHTTRSKVTDVEVSTFSECFLFLFFFFGRKNEAGKCESSTLLHSDLYRGLLVAMAALTLLGNLGSLSYRARVKTRESGHSCGVVVSHLCVSDSFMGIYLIVLFVADRFVD